jgi:hypothetical protein
MSCGFCYTRSVFLNIIWMKSTVFCVVKLSSSERARRFGGTHLLLLQGRKVRQAKNQRKHAGILAYSSTLKHEAISSSETSSCIRNIRCYIPRDRTLHLPPSEAQIQQLLNELHASKHQVGNAPFTYVANARKYPVSENQQ